MKSRMLWTGMPERTAATVCAASCATMEAKNSKLVATPAAQIAGHVASGGTPAATLASINRRGINQVAVVHVTNAKMISQLASMLKSVPPIPNNRH